MANLEDVVSGLEMNAELNQEIRDLQKDSLVQQEDTNSNLRSFIKTMRVQQQQQRQDERERASESESPSQPAGSFKSSFGQSFGESAGAGLGAGVGLASLGFGIGGFFTGLAAGAKGVDYLGTDMNALKNLVGGLDDVFQEMSGKGFVAIGGLLAAGGALGALFGPGKSLKAATGMAAIGLGIGGFFSGLAVGSAGIDILQTDGAGLASMMKNLAEGLGAFADRDLTGLTALLAAGALFGQAPAAAGKAAVGMGLIGAGLGAFFLGLAGMSKVIELIGSDGSGIRNIMVNLAEGLSPLSQVDAGNLLALSPALLALGPGLAVLMGANGIASVADSILGFFRGDNERSVFQKMADDLNALSRVDVTSLKEFDKISEPIMKVGVAIKTVGESDLDDMLEKFEKLQSMSGEVKTITPIIAERVIVSTMESVDANSKGNVTIVDNSTNVDGRQNNVSNMSSDVPLPSATNSSGTRADAYAT